MSWFDTGGIATLAKTALKDMQKHIDKALDIKDDETGTTNTNASIANTPEQLSNETSKQIDGQPDSVWGSFTGSFFPTNDAQRTPSETVTSPPKKQLSKTSSESESLEIISPPITPGSTLSTASPVMSSSIVLGSESVEIIGSSTTEEVSPGELFTPDSVLSDSMMKSPGSVDIISEELGDISEDSLSYNTVSEVPITVFEPHFSGKPVSRQNLHLLLTTSTIPDSMANSSDSEHTIVSDKGATLDSFEYQTQISSSTQSFEEISSQHQSEMELSVNVSGKQLETSQNEPSRRDQHSPNSSDDKSDVEIVKISASDQTSGQTSGDETTTSSDIEIISSPNGDSSSTNSATAKSFHKNLEVLHAIKRPKGHSRELSEISVQSDDSSNQSETEKLLRRISELSEILEQREYKLVEIGRQNAVLREQNQEIISKLEAKKKQSDNLEETNVTVLSGLEKKFQQSIRERELMRKQVVTLKAELSAKINKLDAEKAIVEKEQMIEELRAEGENLSKQVLQHSTIIKKLRAKEKETDATLKRQKEQIEEQIEEAERLKKSLSAKEEVERTQIVAVNRLSGEKKRIDQENLHLKSQLEDLGQKLETLQMSFDAAKRELTEKNNIHTDLNKRTEAYSTLEVERQRLKDENSQLVIQIDDLRQKLRQMEAAVMLREQTLRRENSELLQKLEEIEMRDEDEQSKITMATIPLVRQLESLQSAMNAKKKLFERQEQEWIEKMDSMRLRLVAQNEQETDTNEKLFTLNSTITSLEENLQVTLLRAERAETMLQQTQLEHELQSSELRTKAQRHQETELMLVECQHKIQELEGLAIKEREYFNSEREKIIQELKKAKELPYLDREGSPTVSLGGRSSIDDNNHWQMDDLDCSLSNSGRMAGPAFFQPPLSAASVLENLQSTLKQREGEILQQQWELSRLQSEKNYLTTEVGNLISELDSLRETLAGHEEAMKEFAELREQHDTILQLYGGLLEANEELKLDLLESKQAYRLQINELLQQKRDGSL